MFSISLVALIVFTLLPKAILTECQIDPLRIRPTPLVFNRNLRIVYPNSRTHTTIINQNDEISIACPGNQLLYDGAAVGEYVTTTCVDDRTLHFAGQEVDFYSFKCREIPQNIVRYTQKSCAEGGQEIEIGYLISDSIFIKLIRVCFDNINLTPVYSYYNLTSNIGYRDSHVPRKFFEEDGFYSTSSALDTLYQRNVERGTINQQLDISYSSDAYIKQHGDLFINRGHLTAKGDFVYGFEQLATFHYVNSAPQWASFNGGNWNELEISLRDYADSTRSDLEVYTGVHGISSLRNSMTGEKTELFLHTVGGRKLMPIPQLYWKMIYDRIHDKGIVVLGVNNAYEYTSEDIICKDISEDVSWLNYKLKAGKRNVQLGYTYACSISDFRSVVSRSPYILARNLLT